MILAGDIGGTHTRLAIFEDVDGPLRLVRTKNFLSQNYASLKAVLEQFLLTNGNVTERACFGVPGPVRDGVCHTPNLPWVVDSRELREHFALADVALINDLEAHAYGIAELGANDFIVLHDGHPDPNGNAALIAAGTGLGEAVLHNENGVFRPFATEGGHVDFAPRNQLQIDLLSYCLQTHDHVSYEHVLSGPGLCNICRFLIDTGRGAEPDWLRDEITDGDPAAAIAMAAHYRQSDVCVEALEIFVSIYGAEAANLALKTLASGGVFLGGGIAPRIIDKLTQPVFLNAFFSKGKMTNLLKDFPVKLITNDKTALLGAARIAGGGLQLRIP